MAAKQEEDPEGWGQGHLWGPGCETDTSFLLYTFEVYWKVGSSTFTLSFLSWWADTMLVPMPSTSAWSLQPRDLTKPPEEVTLC